MLDEFHLRIIAGFFFVMWALTMILLAIRIEKCKELKKELNSLV